jgi:tRNA dimethylallyltransferase
MTDSSPERPPVVVVAGPTASGKSRLALRLATHHGGEIVNADSMQVYRHMDIGTAKPSLADRAQVPHHVIDVVDPDSPYDAGRYLREARHAAASIHARSLPVFLTGGTGLYIQAFLDGLLDAGAADPELRASLEEEAERAGERGEPEALHARLARHDPEAARRIHPHDLRRTVRALEICLQTGRAASELRDRHAFRDRPFRVAYLVLDPGREPLATRIDARCAAMIEAGLLQEVRALRDRGFGPELRPMEAIGYRHMQAVVEGLDTLANAQVAMQRDTRHFARRQRTWFRAVDEAIWLHPDDEAAVFKTVEAFLAG